MADMRVLPHFMSSHEINDFFPLVKLDEGENQWTNELEQGITRPSEKLADPGPMGRLDFVPAISKADALMTDKNNFNNTRDGIFCVMGDGDCDAVTKDNGEHTIDSYTNAIGDSDYVSFHRDYDQDTSDSFSLVIDAYIQDDVTESDDRTDDPRTQSAAGSTAVPGVVAEGRPGNASRVLGRREGRASAAPSRWSSSAETCSDPALSSVVIPLGASAPVGSHRIKQRRI